MSKRGPYAKGVAKRAEIAEAALELISSDGYSQTTLKVLATKVGLSQMGLLHYFESKDELFRDILQRRDDRNRVSFLEDDEGELLTDFGEALVALVRYNAAVPGLTQLYARLVSENAEPRQPSFEYFRDRYETLREKSRENFTGRQAEGVLPDSASPDALAIMLWALIDGLQTQWMYDPSIDMAATLEIFLQLIGVIPAPRTETADQ